MRNNIEKWIQNPVFQNVEIIKIEKNKTETIIKFLYRNEENEEMYAVATFDIYNDSEIPDNFIEDPNIIY